MADVTIRITGLKSAIAELDQLSGRLRNFGPIARDLMLAVQADVDQRFRSAPDTEQGGVVFGGVEWPGLTAAYLNANPRRVGGQLLRDTGELAQSYGLGNTGNVAIARPDEVVFGSALPKARGLANKRPQVFVTEELAEVATNIVILYLNGGPINV